jgi:ABC-type branched-subunit amino acid transport system ATPase component
MGIGLMFQEPRGFPTMTVEDNLLLHLMGRGSDDLFAAGLHPLPRSHADQVGELLGLVRLQAARRQRLASLSYGQRRLVDLLALVGRGTRTYLLDEPFAGLDPHSLEALLLLLGRIRAEGALVLLVSHEPPLVRELADRVLVLDRGRVVLQGRPAEVFDSDEFRKVYLG